MKGGVRLEDGEERGNERPKRSGKWMGARRTLVSALSHTLHSPALFIYACLFLSLLNSFCLFLSHYFFLQANFNSHTHRYAQHSTMKTNVLHLF